MAAQSAEQVRNEKAVRELYRLAEAASKDTTKFVSQFADGGYFYDVAAGKKYYGKDIGQTVDIYAAVFPDLYQADHVAGRALRMATGLSAPGDNSRAGNNSG